MQSSKTRPLYAKVDCESCIACGICQLKAARLFEYDEEGIAILTVDNNQGTVPLPTEDIPAFKEAYTNCPVGAIKRSDTPFNNA